MLITNNKSNSLKITLLISLFFLQSWTNPVQSATTFYASTGCGAFSYSCTSASTAIAKIKENYELFGHCNVNVSPTGGWNFLYNATDPAYVGNNLEYRVEQQNTQVQLGDEFPQTDGSITCVNQPIFIEPIERAVLDEKDSETPKNIGLPKCPTGNPCDPSTGNKHQQEIDFVGENTGLSFSRSYNSALVTFDIGLGSGWTHQWGANLDITPTKITVRQTDGRSESFTSINNLWQSDTDSTLSLTKDSTGYTLQSDSGSTERYDLTGHISSQTDRVGNQTLFTYNNDLLDTVTGPYGHVMQFTYNQNNLIDVITDPDNQQYSYQYDIQGNLIKVIYPDTSFKLYHYEDSQHPFSLTGITDENGDRFATFAYGADGKAISTAHAITSNTTAQEHFDLSYDSATQTTVTDPVRTVEVLTFTENLGVKNLISKINQTDNKGFTRTYDTQNNLISNTDSEGVITSYSYNTRNQRITTTEAAGTPEERMTQISYLSPDLDLPTLITKPSVAAGQSFQTQIQYNPDQTVQEITLNGYQADGTAISRSTAFQYNTVGQVTQIDGPLTAVNDVTTLSYYQCTTGAQCGQLASVTNALGHQTLYDSYDNNGRIKQTTSVLGVITRYNYDSRGRLIQILQTPPTGQGTPRTTVYTYDAVGQLLTVTTADNIRLSYSYDAAHDLRSITDNLGNRIEYSYDLKGNRTHENIKDASGTLVNTVQTRYDQRNHVETINKGGLYITQFIHDTVGNLVSETDPNLNPATTHQYDALHRLQTTIDALTNATDYQYDTQDQLKQVQAPNGISTQYVYDDFEQLLQEISSDRGVTSYQYDLAGNLISKTNGNNITSTYLYDALNRVTTIDYPGTELDISYLYDTCLNGLGRLCTVSDAQTQTHYQYDPWGNRTQILNNNGSRTYTTQYSFDADDRLLSTTYPSGLQLTHQRDAIGRITDVTSTWAGINQTIASQVDYLPFGALKSITFGNGLQEQRNYDLAYRLIDQTTADLQNRDYFYDATGNLLTISQGEGTTTLPQIDPEIIANAGTDTGDISEEDINPVPIDPQSGQVTRSYNYQYDSLHRLIDETSTYGQRSYSYDANGNRLTRDKIDQLYDLQNLPTTTITRNQRYTYLANDQHLTQINTDKNGTTHIVDLGYDPAGNTLSKNNKGFTYDARNRTESFSKNGVLVAEYRYNAQGERIQKIKHKDDGTLRTLHFHYDQQGHLLGLTRYNNAGLLKAHKDIIWLDSLPIAQVTTRYKNDGTEKSRELIYLHTDHLNTPRLATNASQTTVWSWDSDAFGQGKPDADPDQDGVNTFVPLRFPGQINSEGGVFYNYFRYYDLSTGRYITSDPIGLNGGLNTYAYVAGNPLKFTDPLGLEIEYRLWSYGQGWKVQVLSPGEGAVPHGGFLDPAKVAQCGAEFVGAALVGEELFAAKVLAGVVKGSLKSFFAKNAAKHTGKAFKHDYKYHPRVRQRGVQDPKAHNFPYSFDDAILKAKPIKQLDGSLLYRKTGTLNGKEGHFDIAVNPDKGMIFHRTFVGNK